MRNFTRVSLVIAGSAALVGSMALPASAALTDTTVEVSGGLISIAALPTAAAGTPVVPGETATFQLTDITVTDARAGVLGWSAAVSLSDFTVAGADTTMTPTSSLYTPALAVLTGTSTLAGVAAVDVTAAKTAETQAVVQTATVVSGNNTATWDAALNITTPDQALAGTYAATLTHSVL